MPCSPLHLLHKFIKGQFIFIFFVIQVACALLMAGEDLEKHVGVKDILVDMGIYFQVQVSAINSYLFT